MIRKIIGTVLLAIGVLLIFVLLTYGGPIFPHIIGPVTLSMIGAVVLMWKMRSKKNLQEAAKQRKTEG